MDEHALNIIIAKEEQHQEDQFRSNLPIANLELQKNILRLKL